LARTPTGSIQVKRMAKKRLAKYLAAAGIASRRKCEELVIAGHVKVNGAVCLVPQTMVNETDRVDYEGKHIKFEEPKLYYLLNKPKGYICSSTRKDRTKLILDLFKKVKARLFTVGRLDRDTTGLLLVTNDGAFANQVIHPSSQIQKEYVVKTEQEVMDVHLKKISQGTHIEGIHVKPAKVAKIRRGTLRVVVLEGKKREVRLLVRHAGLTVRELKRTRLGGLRLGSIPAGSWRELTKREREIIFE